MKNSLLLRAALFLGALVSRAETPAFTFPQPGREWHFPRDYGAHPDFRIEWWYVTGHLWTGEATPHRFGFQATFFRQAGEHPGAPETGPAETFGAAPFYLAHMALLEVATGQFRSQERLNRSGWDAGASTETLEVHNGNWDLRLVEPASGRMTLHGGIRSEAAFALNLTPRQPLTFFGQDGVSRKGASPHAASHYLTFARLAAEGTLRLGGAEVPVHGEAWMDHEISSSQLDPGQVGWDWAALQLNDGREIMAYRMRLADGSTDPYSTLAWVEADGTARHQGVEKFHWRNLRTWKSPRTAAVYPNEVEIEAEDPQSGRPVRFRLEPLAADQELRGALGGVAYWEGACRVRDEAGKEVGSAFLELTGYAKALTELR